MDEKYWLAQRYSTQSKQFRGDYQDQQAEQQAEPQHQLGTARSTVADTALTRQFAAGQRQRFVNRFRHNARFRVRLFSAGRWGRVLIVFSHSVFP